MKDRTASHRIFAFGLVASLVWIVIVGRLFMLQIIHGSQFQEKAKIQSQRVVEWDAPRGEILDRHFNRLGVDLAYCAFGTNINLIEDRKKIAEVFAKYTSQTKWEILRKLKSKSPFVWLDRKVDLAVGEQITKENLKGVTRQIQYRRRYPYGTIAGQIIGFTDIDNTGLSGLELQYDEILSGKPGKMISKMDARGRYIPDPSHIIDEPREGNSLVLTIDLIFQSILEEELRDAVKKSRAQGGMGILMNPRTGEILAMASIPNFNPNEASKYNAMERKNRTITDVFEPGSTFKIVTAATALEEKLFTPDDKLFCENGRYRVHNHILKDVHAYGTLSFREVIEKSSNIGTVKIAKALGRRNLYKYARDFGFGTETGLRCIGEVEGTLRPTREWSGLSLYSIAIGQEVAVTGLQLINAYAAIANGGVLMRPRLIYAEIDNEGRIVSQSSPQAIRRVVSRETAETLKSFFEGVVNSGTGRQTKVEGMRIAGKTGTAQRAMTGARGYEESRYTASFVAFCPVDDPELVGLIVIEDPRGAYYGGVVAAPVIKNIFKRIFALPRHSSQLVNLTQVPDEASSWSLRRIPDVRGCWKSLAEEYLEELNFVPHFVGKGGFVSGQIPAPGSEIQEGQNIVLTLSPNEPSFDSDNRVPDVRGASVRKAINLLSRNRIRVEVKGNGRVIQQSLPPGTLAPDGALCVLKCRSVES